LDVCRRLRDLDPVTPILFCSANANPKDMRQAIMPGAQDYVILPDFENNLPVHIEAILRLGDLRSLEAKHEAIRVTRQCVQELLSAVESGVALATASLSEAQRRLLKANALVVFIKAGGTRANFERLWPEALKEAVEDAA
jgi:CheY-like chemotaxis protein